MSRFIISPEAKLDLTEIRNCPVANGDRSTAKEAIGELRGAMAKLAAVPGIGHLRFDLAFSRYRAT